MACTINIDTGGALTDVVHFSNTIGANTIIQRDCNQVGLLVSAGLDVECRERIQFLHKNHPELSHQLKPEAKIFVWNEAPLSPEGREKNPEDRNEILNAYRSHLKSLGDIGVPRFKSASTATFNIIAPMNRYLSRRRPDGRGTSKPSARRSPISSCTEFS